MDETAMSEDAWKEDDRLRQHIADLLRAGLATEFEPRAYDSETVQKVVAELQGLPSDDLQGRLEKAGFMITSYRSSEGVEESCETCMYYLSHRRFCQLPELMLPVEPEWSCRLWRI
ncbi:hypothetical protein NRY68_17145 [Acidithiobacillus ferrooxidans]|uniref:hypothetical protein n=1 Tax=Acidithiobacillus ferrooxidans TaxID=920 RepID=UPI0021481661|nr:hypothetical protein [Acidithiobacillus ferrooxidans]MCR1347479.1 hypothetical protein [Acidithiobacillus ferrooxidans]MCR1355368.1 hypothetical protein [Acidithiobacillus ferrooxidans]